MKRIGLAAIAVMMMSGAASAQSLGSDVGVPSYRYQGPHHATSRYAAWPRYHHLRDSRAQMIIVDRHRGWRGERWIAPRPRVYIDRY